jgi:hypothetical protein
MRPVNSAEVRIRPDSFNVGQTIKSISEKTSSHERLDATNANEQFKVPAKDFRNLTDVGKRGLINDNWSLL